MNQKKRWLAKRANQSLRVPYQVKTNRNAQQDALISGLVSVADVWTDGNFDEIRAGGVEISSGTFQRHSKIMWFLFLLGLARMPVCRSLLSESLSHTHTHPQGTNLPNTDPASLTLNTAGDSCQILTISDRLRPQT